MTSLAMCGVVYPSVQPRRVGTLLERCDTLRQEVMHHHHGGQPFVSQEADPRQDRVVVQL
jgi:hypothetical protein